MSSLSASSEAPALSPPSAISVQALSVEYRTSYEKSPTLKSSLRNLGQRKQHRLVKALTDVSLEVPSGAVLGIIGANGAGKSTLLRAIGGIIPPSSGRIEVRGRTTALLSLGIGFNKQLSGRENILLGGLAAGMLPSEIDDRLADVISFSQLEDFIDLPVKTYSSGMYSRLAFSVAVHMDPDILLIDEALSAGDEAFKRRATDKMKELVQSARSILVVSHSMSSVREMCSHAMWLNAGQVMKTGEPVETIASYKEWIAQR